MKKIILGTIILTATPFIIILSGWLLNWLSINSNVLTFAYIMGSLTIIANWCIALAILIQGHSENKTFDLIDGNDEKKTI